MEVCTIIAKNYVAHARVLARSLARHHPDSRLWTLVIDDFDRYIDPEKEPFEVLTPSGIECEPFSYMALRYSVLELSTAVKPWLLRHLMEKTGRPVTYLDPDIKVYGSLHALDELAGRHGVALIPHNTEPIPPDGHKPSQVDVMIAGAYNLGYVSVAARSEVEHLLDWWADRLRRDCRVDPAWGYFVDQRWFDLVPGFLTDFAIVREPEYDVAYWNLHSRRLEHDAERYRVDGRPLAFFHFSGFDATRPLALSRHQDRIDVTEDPVLERLLGEYAREVMAEGHAISRKWPYGYLALGDGTEIDDFVRSFCEEFEDDQARRNGSTESVFTLSGARSFHAWLAEDAPGAPAGVNRVLARLYEDRGDLEAKFPDLSGSDRDGLLAWANESGRNECPLLDKATRPNDRASSSFSPPRDRERPSVARGSLTQLPDGPWGVNIVGYFHSQGELGESARQLVNAFDQQGIPSAPIHDWTIPLIEEGQPYATLAPSNAPYIVNLICIAPDALPEFARHAGERFFAGRYTIALWLCDEPPSSDSLVPVQEVWVPSAYVASLVSPVASVPVTTIPLPVEPAPFEHLSRAQVGLPADEYLFVVSVEQGDDLGRKNPVGAIEAFSRAFTCDGDARQLVIAVPAERQPGVVEELRAAAAERSDIQVIEVPPERQAAIGLMAACDCFVSLHRTEPFGLAMAQAMWLGKPVVATSYSGNLEFMTDENSMLVDYRLARRQPDSSRPGDLEWAEPDLGHASALMRSLMDDPVRARVTGSRAASDIRRTHSSGAAIEVIKRRLDAIQGAGQGPPPLSARRRSGRLAQVESRIKSGPPPDPRGGPQQRIRGALRKAILRGLRPYADYQQKVNLALLDAIDGWQPDRAERLAEVPIAEAQLFAALRGAGQLRASVEAQGRGLDELGRMITLQADRGLYLALAELGRRHAAVTKDPGAPSDSLGLAPFELRGYSQNGEDGVLAEILRRVGVLNRYFVEFGVESGVEGNCVYLADVAGWQGLFMEADDRLYRLLARKYAARRDIRTLQATVTSENIDDLLTEAAAPAEPDVMSIDVDGQDYWIWEAIAQHRPRVLVIEYNSALDPRRRLVQPNELDRSWDGTEYFGASVGALEALADRKGYRLVYTELSGNDAFFVRSDLVRHAFAPREEVEVRAAPNYFQTGYRHPPAGADQRYLDLDSGQLVEVQSIRAD